MTAITSSESIASRAHDQDFGAGVPGPVLVARRDEPLPSDASDLSNVLPFARPRRQNAVQELPPSAIDAADRPAPVGKIGMTRTAVVLAGSLALHGMLLAFFWRDPPPLASIGIEAITVEFTLGATAAAGLAVTPGEQEVQAVAPSETRSEQDEPVTQQTNVATLMPQEVPVAAQEAAPEAKPQDRPPEVATVEARPLEEPPPPETTVSEIPAEAKPIERPPEQTVQPPPVPTATTAPERKRIAAPTRNKAAETKQRAAAAPSNAASGVGVGRSDRSANYNGMVAAHLSRYKQYPAAARAAGAKGVATVSFSLDGGGLVTLVRLAHGSGNASIDQEVVAMVRRASPFPRPPDGQGRNFTVPVRFDLR